MTGSFLEQFAGPSSGLNRPAFLTVGPDGSVFTSTDPGTGVRDTVLRIDQTKTASTFISANNPGGNGGLLNAKGMAFGPDGNFYVGSSDSDQVLRYDGNTGTFIDVFVAAGDGGLDSPAGILFGPDRNNDSVQDLYVTSNLTNQVLAYSGIDGSYIGEFVAAGSGGLSGPHDMQFGADGNLYVVSSATSYERVFRFDGTTGSFVDLPVATGSGVGPETAFIAFGPNGDLYVGSEYANEIMRDRTGPIVTLSEAGTSAITVDFSTADGTATHGNDYATVSGRLTFAPGETSKRIIVSPVDDGVNETNETFSVNLSNGSGATIADNQGVVTILNTQTKFFVINDNATQDRTYKYESSGAAIVSNSLDFANTSPRGVAANAAGTMVWVVDANKKVYVYNNAGTLLGSWTLGSISSSAQLQGIATNGTDIWVTDSYQDKVYRYSGAASRLSGSQNAVSSFSLNKNNKNAKGIVTDGVSIWTVDDSSSNKVFKYTLSGSLLGSWSIDSANSTPSGLTINPNNVSDIWIVDSGTDRVYQYTGAATRTSGSQSAAANFALAAGNTNPQGIADPPGVELTAPASTPVATPSGFLGWLNDASANVSIETPTVSPILVQLKRASLVVEPIRIMGYAAIPSPVAIDSHSNDNAPAGIWLNDKNSLLAKWLDAGDLVA